MLIPDKNNLSPGGPTTSVKRYADPSVAIKVSEKEDIETIQSAESQESTSAFPWLTANRLVKTDASKALESVAALTQYAVPITDALNNLKTLGVASNGQLLVGSTGVDPALATITGTANEVTVTNGAGTITLSLPDAITLVTLTTTGGRICKTTRVTTTYQILVTDHIMFCNTDGSSWTATLPVGVEGQTLKIINSGSAGETLTLAPNGAEHLIGANSNITIADSETVEITYNATDGWY